MNPKDLPAFPGLHPSAECRYTDSGMTLRDYFAAKAMQSKLLCEFPRDIPDGAKGKTVSEWVAEQSYKMADAMLEAREK